MTRSAKASTEAGQGRRLEAQPGADGQMPEELEAPAVIPDVSTEAPQASAGTSGGAKKPKK
ncbi:MAG: hypothetical protein OEY14_11455, partial [Myxococcales bacterium]|nr:hypothetical protein [Myxococcales bacterium]